MQHFAGFYSLHHPDHCSGFSPFGRMIFYLYAIVAWGGVVIFTVYVMGYFSLEKTPTYFLVIFVYTLVTPVLWLTPTLFVVHRLQDEKIMWLEIVEHSLQIEYERLQQMVLQTAPKNKINTKVEAIKRDKHLYDLFEQMPVWPFDLRRIQTIVVGNLIQIIAFLITLYSFAKGHFY